MNHLRFFLHLSLNASNCISPFLFSGLLKLEPTFPYNAGLPGIGFQSFPHTLRYLDFTINKTKKQTLNSFLLALSNSSPPVRTSNSPSLTSDKPKGFNMGLKVPTSSSPKLSPTEITSPNPNIKLNTLKQ